MAELQIVEWVYGVGPLAKSHKIIERVCGVDTFGGAIKLLNGTTE